MADEEGKGLRGELEELRDELKLKVHLASMDTKEEWEKLEGKWESFSSKANLGETAGNIEAALELLGKEIREGYQRIKKAL